MLYKYSIKKANGTLIVNNKKLDIPSSTRLKEIIKVIYRRHKDLLRLNKSYAFHLSERGDYLHQVALVSFYKSGDKVKVEIHSTGYNNDDIIMYDPLWTDPFGNITPIGVPPLGYLPPVSDPWNLHSFWTPIGGVTQKLLLIHHHQDHHLLLRPLLGLVLVLVLLVLDLFPLVLVYLVEFN